MIVGGPPLINSANCAIEIHFQKQCCNAICGYAILCNKSVSARHVFVARPGSPTELAGL